MEWSALISSLAVHGMTQHQIAEECQCAQSTISDLATGKNRRPSYQIGKTLEQLYARQAATDPDNAARDVPHVSQPQETAA